MEPEVRAISVSVNGRRVTAHVPVTWLLSDLLRDALGLTGTKVSCDMQVCGACTVLVDGHPVSSCTYLAIDVDGREVRSVEGLAQPDGSLNELQQAFIDHFGFQCGFCTPGFLMMATALLGENASPSEEEVVDYLEGNICRCTGYRQIVDSVMAASRGPEGAAG